MRTSLFPALLIGLLLCWQTALRAEILHPEAAIEAEEHSVTHARAGGFILARQCEQCDMLSLEIDAATKAYANGKEVPIGSIPSQDKTSITVIYDPKSKVAKRVLW